MRPFLLLKLVNIFFLFLMAFLLGGSKKNRPLEFVQVDCHIFDWSGKIYKKYPGWLCHFFEDGSYLIGKTKGKRLNYFSANGSMVWSKEVSFHHELELSQDKKKIFFLTDEIVSVNGIKTRYDVFNIIDRQGRELHRWSMGDHIVEISKILEGKNFKTPKYTFNHKLYGLVNENMHLNSFKEIPPNDLYPKLSYMKPGNFIAGINCLGFFLFFDPTLSHIEKVFHYQRPLDCNCHDVQVLPNGHILFFRNYDNFLNEGPSLVEIDPLTESIAWSLRLNTSDREKSKARGSVQKLPNGNLLFANLGQDSFMSVGEISPEGNISRALDQRALSKAGIDKPYRVRAYKELASFLKNAW